MFILFHIGMPRTRHQANGEGRRLQPKKGYYWFVFTTSFCYKLCILIPKCHEKSHDVWNIDIKIHWSCKIIKHFLLYFQYYCFILDSKEPEVRRSSRGRILTKKGQPYRYTCESPSIESKNLHKPRYLY